MIKPIGNNKKQTEKGSALVEASGVLLCVIPLTTSLLICGYWTFAHNWLCYQAEQTLYCLAEGASASACKRDFETQVREFLPFGALKTKVNKYPQTFTINYRWTHGIPPFDGIELTNHKTLDIREIAKRKAL